MTNDPTTHTTRPDGGEEFHSESRRGAERTAGGETRRRRFERPPETAGTEADHDREEIEPGAADLR